eukprot:14065727-Ditylum_brightwellii.AAC.1
MSPLGRHLGHLKALQSRGPDDPTLEEGKLLAAQQQSLINAQVNMVNYTIHHRYSYQCWKIIVNVIIQKEKINNKIHKIQVIHIYEADYSAMLGIIWCNLIKSSENDKLSIKVRLEVKLGMMLTLLHLLKKSNTTSQNAAGNH